MAVHFHFLSNADLKQRRRLKEFIPEVFNAYKKSLKSLQVIFCSDDYLLEINRKHLQHDYYTDIITFDLSEKADDIIAELYISVDRVTDNATSHAISIEAELHRVIFHGCLHLCGLQDKKPADVKRMRAAEDKVLTEYFNVPRGT